MVKFKTKLSKLGNSVGVFIPKPLRDSLDLEIGDDIEMEEKGDSIILRKSK
ncbi:MAG: AbrB/MazE/SpoVT family DNA-binding domain-containing protein [Candidatus Nitrosocosmicus sp.]|nr:AbrB/MazE/SpoVT family DNA-binding domain-containing protein [Candidatus Nitrosocosmicus sp.]